MTGNRAKLLVVDDEADVLYSFRRLFDRADIELLEAPDGTAALRLMREHQPDVVLMDIRMPGPDGIATLKEIRKTDPRTPIILMTAYASTQTTIEAMKAGAFDYVLKPFDVEKIRQVIHDAIRVSRTMRQRVSYETSDPAGGASEEIVGRSAPMQDVYKLIGRLAGSDLPVLITGESGTGKELAARAIYQHSPRAPKPFLAVNCAAIPEELLESELFGFQRGAFTGAASAKPGKFEVCDGGTILLDEIGELPLPLQGKLLRVLESGDIEKIGSTRSTKVDVRVMAATNRDLRELIDDGKFRSDLYFRLRVVELRMPTLRERLDDIPELAEYFIRIHAPALGRTEAAISPEALAHLRQYAFPGNVRELENIIRNALVRSAAPVLRAEDLELGADASAPGHALRSAASIELADDALFDALFEEILKRQPLPADIDGFDIIEERLIRRALEHCQGNQSRASRLLGITRNTLRKRVQKYGLVIRRSIEQETA